MPAFYVLVMDAYKDDDDYWVYSASAKKKSSLQELECYEDPPNRLPKARFVALSSTRVSVRPCAGGNAEGGTIVGINHSEA